ncbi:HEAT repeat domain-containing protein [Dolichospermum circinale CS-1225]|uniref:HEAT repeat domain-containing protein n=1 Tax=Dolichospermum circinale TaxID=109265 RepID=UPI0004109EF4|nr:HEAT repeat domain-containing protein [Dolichospermum circinale]MDB9459566.1 HEAT repeat domain-containing protein [Dolichospermum circinale CS-545/17]MDB9465496.1 HEAT repeat domain-containing protein [Dolichospermum circinale CS-539/09]MDB9472634.1 HEAT repeat domain-containing protein [Dolichospermum circinale CS-539]MDB9520772.1 HEAT repeat domain-containing protein [Dolichospermum circinale CS-1225]
MDELIRAIATAETPDQLVTAVKNLAAIKDTSAISTLIAVFGYNNPEAAIVAAAALTELGEVAVPQLLDLDDYNYGARAYSIRTLAAIADPRALDVLIDTTLTDFAPSVRRAAAKGLGNLQWHKLDIVASQIAINRALETLLCICEDTDWSIRYAAVVGLQALAKVATVRSPIFAKFASMLTNDTEKAVRARVQLAYSQ